MSYEKSGAWPDLFGPSSIKIKSSVAVHRTSRIIPAVFLSSLLPQINNETCEIYEKIMAIDIIEDSIRAALDI